MDAVVVEQAPVDPGAIDLGADDDLPVEVLCVPARDVDFRTAVHEVVRGTDPSGPSWPNMVQEMLRPRFPRVTVVPADALGSLRKRKRWYVLRNGERGPVTSRKILVVDDDPSLRSILSEALEDPRFDVRAAADGPSALELIELWPPDLILVDLGLPLMSGEEFAEQYRAMVPHPAPLVVVSGARDATERATRMGARSVVVKPFDLDFLVTLVDRYA